MIDKANHRIYYDYSTGATFKACKEKARLAHRDGWRALTRESALDFGHAFHAAGQAYYDALAGGYHNIHGQWITFEDNIAIEPLKLAHAAFLRDLAFADAKLPVAMEADERRSIERGLALVEAYIWRWRDEPYDNLLRASGEPHTEVGFSYYLTTIDDWEIWYVGYIDRIMVNRATGRPVIFELKTTTQALSVYKLQCKPNDQVTGYFPPALAINADIRECVWDCVFISSRKSDLQKAIKDRWFMYGIDIHADCDRQTTSRSNEDIAEFRADQEEWAIEYAKWMLRSDSARWARTAPGACNTYGGCQFRKRCSINLNVDQELELMQSCFKIERL